MSRTIPSDEQRQPVYVSRQSVVGHGSCVAIPASQSYLPMSWYVESAWTAWRIRSRMEGESTEVECSEDCVGCGVVIDAIEPHRVLAELRLASGRSVRVWEGVAAHTSSTGIIDILCSSVTSLHANETFTFAGRQRVWFPVGSAYPGRAQSVAVGPCASPQRWAFGAGLMYCVQGYSRPIIQAVLPSNGKRGEVQRISSLTRERSPAQSCARLGTVVGHVFQ
eukprot:scaffold211_cov443-Pavlova_lutheri.AAC.2